MPVKREPPRKVRKVTKRELEKRAKAAQEEDWRLMDLQAAEQKRKAKKTRPPAWIEAHQRAVRKYREKKERLKRLKGKLSRVWSSWPEWKL